MKSPTTPLARQYLAALRRRLENAPRGSDRGIRADELGRAALALGVGTLELASLHEKAMQALTPDRCSAETLRRIRRQCGRFLLEALTPIEHSHRRLKREILQRQTAEAALRQSQQHTRALLKESHGMERRLRRLSHQVLTVQEDERKKISRELHDQIAQMLAGVNVHLAAFTCAVAVSRAGLGRKIRTTQRLVEKSVTAVHRFAQELRPPMLDDLGLIPALQAYMNNYMERTGVRVQLTIHAGVERLPSAKRLVLYRVAQAALTNVSQHAEATRVVVTVIKTADAIEMRIRDNGRSFDVARILSGQGKRLGLVGMRERTGMVGGRFDVESAAGKGTTVCVQIPLGSGGNNAHR